MNIIFKDNLLNLNERFIVLDLDTFKFPDGTLHTACCVVENIPIPELAEVDNQRKLHSDLVKNYGLKNWNYCEQVLDHLKGKWNGELDSFYQNISERIQRFKTQDLDDSWTPVIDKT
jgi:hypothetical protein